MNKPFSLIVTAVLLSGCGDETSKCGDSLVTDEVSSLVVQIFEPQTAQLESQLIMFAGFQPVDLKMVILGVSGMRETQVYDSNIKKRFCTATVTFKLTSGDAAKDKQIVESGGTFGALFGQGDVFLKLFNGLERTANYTIQTADDGQQYIDAELAD